ncbi:unnamed protein product [Protopolystoma xenopodis]|uniref:Uncharacterized protein n=1 Tax=Protopolystoma xenopodis TaxID=117903 RepID=A0A448WI53_9PLAT|nr:unnamed protein product [Protopolystoma xenopodis]
MKVGVFRGQEGGRVSHVHSKGMYGVCSPLVGPASGVATAPIDQWCVFAVMTGSHNEACIKGDFRLWHRLKARSQRLYVCRCLVLPPMEASLCLRLPGLVEPRRSVYPSFGGIASGPFGRRACIRVVAPFVPFCTLSPAPRPDDSVDWIGYIPRRRLPSSPALPMRVSHFWHASTRL